MIPQTPTPGMRARAATQCPCPDTGEVGCFYYTGDSCRTPGSRVSEIYPSLYDLFRANLDAPLGWRDTGPSRVYVFEPPTPDKHV